MRKIRELIVRESSVEGESGNLTVLVRVLLLLFVPYMLSVAIVCVKYALVGYAVFSFVSAALFAGLLVGSYTMAAGRVRLCMTAVLLVGSYIMSVAFGWRESFHLLLFVCFMLFWYDPSIGIRRKFIQSAGACAIFCLICFRSPLGKTLLTPGSAGYYYLAYANIVFSILCLSIIAYGYCTQFVEAERKLYLYNRELKKLSETDQLTKLPNRRFAQDELRIIEENFVNSGSLLSVAIGDIDFFKRVNDNFGHDAGDYVLAKLSELLDRFMDGKGFVVRWGGEEFLFVMEGMNGDDAFVAMEQLRADIQSAEFIYHDNVIPITMTIGVEEYGGPRVGIDPTIDAADKKLYIGKNGGRNRVVY